MNPFFTTLTITYLIYPLLGLLLVGLGVFIAKKNQLLSNKRFVLYFLISVAVLVLPALLGFFDYNFMPYGYILLSILYIILGAYNIGIVSVKKVISYNIQKNLGYSLIAASNETVKRILSNEITMIEEVIDAYYTSESNDGFILYRRTDHHSGCIAIIETFFFKLD